MCTLTREDARCVRRDLSLALGDAENRKKRLVLSAGRTSTLALTVNAERKILSVYSTRTASAYVVTRTTIFQAAAADQLNPAASTKTTFVPLVTVPSSTFLRLNHVNYSVVCSTVVKDVSNVTQD